MKKLSLLIAIVALLAIAAGPVAAAPAGNPQVHSWAVTCGGTTITVLAREGIPGWDANLVKGDQPMLFRGGHLTYWVNGVVVAEIEGMQAPGLAGRLIECRLEGPLDVDPDVYHLVADPAWMQVVP